MAAGKTTLGRALAKHLKLPFYDLDAYIEEREHQSVNELIHEKGELYFRKLERQALEEVLQAPQFVLAVGGGTPCFYENMELLNQNSKSFYLRTSPGMLADRLKDTQDMRPLIAHLPNKALAEFAAKHLFERGVFYEQAHFILDANAAIDQNIREIEQKH
jgi:shikimate kinase